MVAAAEFTKPTYVGLKENEPPPALPIWFLKWGRSNKRIPRRADGTLKSG